MKQRYIRHQALNKHGQVVATAIVCAGRVFPYSAAANIAQIRTKSTAEFLSCKLSVQTFEQWKHYALTENEQEAVKFAKHIIEVG